MLHFGELTVERAGELNVFTVQVRLDTLDPEAVRVELYADGVGDGLAERVLMIRGEQLSGGGEAGYLYGAAVSAVRPAAEYTPRVIAYCPGLLTPLEEGRILWRG